MRTFRWGLAVVALAAGTVVGVQLGRARADAAPAATVSRSITLVGTEFHPLDIRIGVQYKPNSGGGAIADFVNDGSSRIPGSAYLEAGLDLPAGAALTSVTMYYQDCGYGPGPGVFVSDQRFYVGAYSPSTGSFTSIRPEAAGPFGDCAQRYAYYRSGSPLTTVVAGKRYAIGVNVINDGVALVADGATPPTDATFVLYGALVRYTCTSPC